MSFFLKMGQSRPLFVYFRCFHIPIQMTNIQFEQFKLKKRRWCAWDSNPGRHDGRRRRIHWAIAAPLVYQLLHVRSYQAQRLLGRVRSTSSKRGLLFSFFFFSVDSWQLTFNIRFCRWLDSTRRPLVLEVIALPNEQQLRSCFIYALLLHRQTFYIDPVMKDLYVFLSLFALKFRCIKIVSHALLIFKNGIRTLVLRVIAQNLTTDQP